VSFLQKLIVRSVRVSSTLAADMARSSLRPFIDRIERSHGASPDVVRELLENCALPVLILERLWKDTRRALERGVERAELVRTLHEIRELLGRRGPDS